MRYLSREVFENLCAQGRIRRAMVGVLKITLPEPGGAFQFEDCMAVENPPEDGKPLPAGYRPRPCA